MAESGFTIFEAQFREMNAAESFVEENDYQIIELDNFDGEVEENDVSINSVFKKKESAELYGRFVKVTQRYTEVKIDNNGGQKEIEKYKWKCLVDNCRHPKVKTGFIGSSKSIREHFKSDHPEIDLNNKYQDQDEFTTKQEGFEDAMADFWVDARIPYQCGNFQTFRNMCGILNNTIKVICDKTVRKRITAKCESFDQNMIQNFLKVDYVACTADIWTSYGQSYLGMTGENFNFNLIIYNFNTISLLHKVHWLHPTTHEREWCYCMQENHRITYWRKNC